ncbi:hypothetical protein BC833DRAFT_562459 [Globomyces pollinis-pini]|nr:hypothetical protein BC833DRAFT_562459 [Globomyces pollinis-pini]
MEQITDEITQMSNKINAIGQLLKKPSKEWTEEEKEECGSKEHLREERKQLRDKELELLKEQTILLQREQNQGISSLITAGTAMDIDVRPFDSAIYQSKKNQYFPFFDPMIEKYLIHFGDNALLATDNVIHEVNQIISKRVVEKYLPIICSTSRGMGKTAFMEAVGMQLVKPHLKNQLIMDALAYGRILSFDFAGAAVETAIPSQSEIRTFFTRLMVYFLCRMFDGTQVDGIHFEKISQFASVTDINGRQNKFTRWLRKSIMLNADDMMDEYIRLTNLAFKVNCSSPPVFLLDEIQGLLKPTTVQSMYKDDQVVNHSFLSLLLTQLAVKYKPVCICGTNSGNIINIADKSKIIPQFISLSTVLKEDDYKAFCDQSI